MKTNIRTTKRILSIVLIFFFISIVPVSQLVHATKDDDVLKLSDKDSITIALKNSKDLKKMNLALSSMNRKLISLKKLSDEMDKALKALDEYQILYSKEKKMLNSSSKDKFQEYLNLQKEIFEISQDNKINQNEKKRRIQEIQYQLSILNFTEDESKLLMTTKETSQLFAYKIMFKKLGIDNPYISDREKFEKFIKPRDFFWYSMEAEIKKTRNKKSQLKNTIELSTIKSFNVLYQLNQMVKIKEDIYNIQNKDFKQTCIKFKNGQVSRLERDCVERELKKCALDLENTKRNKDNMEMNFKKLLGISLYKNIEIINKTDTAKLSLDKEDYLKNAIKNRAEILNDNIDIDVKKRELSIIKKYLASKDIEWIEGENSVCQAEIKLNNSKNLIEKDILSSYIEIENYKNKLEMSHKTLNNAKEKLKDVNKTHEVGMSTLLATLKAKLYVTQCEIESIKSNLDYQESLYKIKFASEIGYINKGGFTNEK
ncbi:outer membrane efflux protein [Clostridium acetireducens DSM 10703]|uniref:Outer membrane efflux protein n=1 Tax=Clostridium acetireducens DSM 10703 TaxID=1121290 RepID=A0A1E8F0K6_9CLOT|nr:TolC family protein [Clostridium acetireducens]OFI06983.1 outer membrane efflux protein [Clostridium acetireducens DSM 10703]